MYTEGSNYQFRYRTYKIVGGTTYHSSAFLQKSALVSYNQNTIFHSFTLPSGADGILLERLDLGGAAVAWVNLTLTNQYDDGDYLGFASPLTTPWNIGAPSLNVATGYSILKSDDGYGLKSDLPVIASNVTGNNTGDQDLSNLATQDLALALAIAL